MVKFNATEKYLKTKYAGQEHSPKESFGPLEEGGKMVSKNLTKDNEK